MNNIIPSKHKSLSSYRDTMFRILKSMYPDASNSDLYDGIDYSISKRFKNFNLTVQNNYTNSDIELTMLEMLDYIAKRQPIITSYGTMFKRHEVVPNPMSKVIQNFLDLRKKHKKEMFKYPKGSEMFEHYNLLQALDKIDVNGIYGLIGLYVSLIYDVNVSPAVTSTGRSLISSAIMCFEGFLGNNVKFGSLNDILIFIDNVRREYSRWKYADRDVLKPDGYVTDVECFNKLILNCGYKYIPSSEDMDIVWKIIQNCNQTELNRLFYKNNLYCFMDLPISRTLMIKIITGMQRPYIEPSNPPIEILNDLNSLKDLLIEYVFYCYQYMDRMIRNKEMIKSVSIVSDTDSSFVSLDAWYNYNLQYLKDYDCPILHQQIDVYKMIENSKLSDDYPWKDSETPEWYNAINKDKLITFAKRNEFGNIDSSEYQAIEFVDAPKDYDFYNEEVINKKRAIDAIKIIPQDNLKFALINIMCYILSSVINLYMIDFTKQSGSYRTDALCRINMKNEFYMSRIMLTDAKKHYASLQILQEGNYLGEGVLDVKGIDCLTKSSFSKDTQKALRKILLEDILTGKVDQLKIIKDIAIFEKTIFHDLKNGSKKYYKPVTIKSIDHYDTPLRIQGIKAAIAWNYVKGDDLPGFNLNDRNSLDIIKINIDHNILEMVKGIYPYQFSKFSDILNPKCDIVTEGVSINTIFKGTIDSIALPKDVPVPEWLKLIIDYDQIISDNVSGFPLSSVGICQFGKKKANWSNVVHL